MRSEPNIYFSESEEEQIIAAIGEAENMTSGEIRVHISKAADADSLEATKAIFGELRMFNTKYRNAVLLHISMGSKQFAIFGDEGIDRVAPDNFWESTRDIIQSYFVKGEMAKGIIAGISNVGKIMKAHFPLDPDDINELPDQITYS